MLDGSAWLASNILNEWTTKHDAKGTKPDVTITELNKEKDAAHLLLTAEF